MKKGLLISLISLSLMSPYLLAQDSANDIPNSPSETTGNPDNFSVTNTENNASSTTTSPTSPTTPQATPVAAPAALETVEPEALNLDEAVQPLDAAEQVDEQPTPSSADTSDNNDKKNSTYTVEETPVTEVVLDNAQAPATTVSSTPKVEEKELPIVDSSIIVQNETYYRKMMSTQPHGTLLQDFYTSGKKRSDPYLVTDIEKAKVNDFNLANYNKLNIFGAFVLWFENDQMKSKGVYDNGSPKGFWRSWHANGQKKSAGYYKANVKDGQWTSWYDNGKRMQKGLYKNGRKEGVWITWYRNGKKKQAGRYSSGEKVERWSYWDTSGKPIKRQ